MMPQNPAELDQIRSHCQSMVNKRASLSAAAALIPLPGVDISADMVIMVDLLTKINAQFGLDSQQVSQLEPERQKILFVLITSAGSEVIGKAITTAVVRNLLKKINTKLITNRFIPLLGRCLSATISFGAMKYLGDSHIEQCYQIAKDYLHSVDTKKVDDVIDI